MEEDTKTSQERLCATMYDLYESGLSVERVLVLGYDLAIRLIAKETHPEVYELAHIELFKDPATIMQAASLLKEASNEIGMSRAAQVWSFSQMSEHPETRTGPLSDGENHDAI